MCASSPRLLALSLCRRHTCTLAAIIELNTRIGLSHLVLLMPVLKQMMLAFVERNQREEVMQRLKRKHPSRA